MREVGRSEGEEKVREVGDEREGRKEKVGGWQIEGGYERRRRER